MFKEMVVGVRKKHWVLGSLSLTVFLLLLVFTSKPLQPHSPVLEVSEISFLRRHIANDNSVGATGDEVPPPTPPNTVNPHSLLNPLSLPSDHRILPPQPHMHLTSQQRQELAKQGVLLLDEEENQNLEANNPVGLLEPQQIQDIEPLFQEQQVAQNEQHKQINNPQNKQAQQLKPQIVKYKNSLQVQHQIKQQQFQQQQNQQQTQVKSNQVQIQNNPEHNQLQQFPQVQQQQTQNQVNQQYQNVNPQNKSAIQNTPVNPDLIVEIQEGDGAGQISQHAQWLQRVELQHQDFLRQQHHLLEHNTQSQHQRLQKTTVLSGTGGTGGQMWHGRRITYEGIRQQGLDVMRRMIQREYSMTGRDMQFTPGQEVMGDNVRRVLVLSTWRSGSTYLGDLLNAYPGTYYSFEPLHHLLKNHHLEDGPLVEIAQDLLRKILTCDYNGIDDYLNYARNNTFLLNHNTRLWTSCARNRALCFDKEYLSRACHLMPMNVVKTVRVGLSPVVELLQDPSLNLRVLHLIRDPRGCLHSRLKLSWCNSDVCRDPTTVCHDLLTDLTLSDWVQEHFPNRYLMVRYEDLGLKPEEKAHEIYKFLQLSYNKHVSHFVKVHTNPSRKGSKNHKDAYSTFRDSKATIFAWRRALEYANVKEIQGVCMEALQRLKLRIFESEEEYLNASIPVLLDV